MQLILYSKPGCHLCEGLQEKLEQIEKREFTLEVRDITTKEDWFKAYQYEIPVLAWLTEEGEEVKLPRPSPRLNVQQMEQFLQKHLLTGN
jgi:hypothetical protein